MMGIVKPQLDAKFEVASLSRCRNNPLVFFFASIRTTDLQNTLNVLGLFLFISHVTTTKIKLKQNCFVSVVFQM